MTTYKLQLGPGDSSLIRFKVSKFSKIQFQFMWEGILGQPWFEVPK